MARTHRKKYQQVLEAVTGSVWAIRDDKLEEICGFLSSKASGVHISLDQIRATFRAQFEDEDEGEDQDSGSLRVEDGLALIDVFGTISPRMSILSQFSGGTSTASLEQQIRAADMNSEVQKVVLLIDSPGGNATGVDEVYRTLRGLGKPSVAVARNSVDSAAYWIASGADRIYATPSTSVGNVGVYAVTEERVKSAEARGIKYNVFRAGAAKGAGSPYEEMTEAQRETIESQLQSVYSQFVSSVAEGRGVSATTVISDFGRGGSFLAEQALDRGMVDKVGLFEDLVNGLRARQASSIGFAFAKQEGAEMQLTNRIRAALYARGLIDDINVEEKECLTALKAFFAATNQNPEDNESSILQALSVSSQVAVPPPPEPPQVPDVQSALREERTRVADLRARATLLRVPEAEVEKAINSGASVESAVVAWTAADFPLERGEPVAAGPLSNIVPGAAQADKFVAGATEVLYSRFPTCNREALDQKVLDTWGHSLKYTSMIEMAQQILTSQRNRPVMGSKEQIATEFLQLGGTDVRYLTEGSANMAADHPDLLSALASKALDSAVPTADFSYTQWAERMGDLPDFKPATIIEMGIFAELDVIGDDEESPQKKLHSQLQSYIQVDRYRNKVAMTVYMMVNDDLSGFARMLSSFPTAAERTLNNNLIRLLASGTSLTMLDGSVAVATDAVTGANLGTGAAISHTSLAEHRKLHRLQKNLGAEGVDVPIDVPPTILLCPATLETVALQYTGNYLLYPAADTNINTVRASITPVIDAYLDGFSTAQWYTFIPPSVHSPLGYAFQRGFGPTGQRSTWFDNDTGSRYVALETRFGTVFKSRRGLVANAGS